MEQIDYKEKYEQALERARQFSEKPYLEDSAGIVEYIFPELKESEDERIRQKLIDYCDCSHVTDTFNGIPWENVRAWLEKQGEQKPAWSEEDEAMWAEISDLLWEGYKQSGSKFSWDDIRNWVNPKLKYIIPQNTWKPSDKQMHYLSWIANIKLGDSVVEQDVSKHLNELLEDLKKLREE